MKILIAILMGLGLAHAANAAPKEISKRLLKTVLKNHLVVAEVKHPARGLKLFDACFDGINFISKSGAKATRCIEKQWEIDNDDKAEVPPSEHILTDAEYKAKLNGKNGGLRDHFYTPTCVKFEEYDPSGYVNRRSRKAVNCRWVQGKDLPIGHYAEGNSEQAFDFFNICDYEDVEAKFPLSQVIRIYRLHDNITGHKVYYHSSHADRAHPGYRRATYTIPYCQDLPSGKN